MTRVPANPNSRDIERPCEKGLPANLDHAFTLCKDLCDGVVSDLGDPCHTVTSGQLEGGQLLAGEQPGLCQPAPPTGDTLCSQPPHTAGHYPRGSVHRPHTPQDLLTLEDGQALTSAAHLGLTTHHHISPTPGGGGSQPGSLPYTQEETPPPLEELHATQPGLCQPVPPTGDAFCSQPPHTAGHYPSGSGCRPHTMEDLLTLEDGQALTSAVHLGLTTHHHITPTPGGGWSQPGSLPYTQEETPPPLEELHATQPGLCQPAPPTGDALCTQPSHTGGHYPPGSGHRLHTLEVLLTLEDQHDPTPAVHWGLTTHHHITPTHGGGGSQPGLIPHAQEGTSPLEELHATPTSSHLVSMAILQAITT